MQHNTFREVNDGFEIHHKADDFGRMRDMLGEGADALGSVSAAAIENSGRALGKVRGAGEAAVRVAERFTQPSTRTLEEDVLLDDGGPVLPTDL